MWDTLPCGTDPEPLLDYAAEHAAPAQGTHEATCPYCQAAISELSDLWQPVNQWITRDLATPEHFAATVMHRVRRIVQSPRHAATVGARGITTVTSWVLGLIATAATLDTPGITGITGSPAPPQPGRRRRRAQVRYGADGVDIAELGETDIGVTLVVTALPDTNLPELADLVRHNIVTAIIQETGIRAAEVNITIDDLDLELRATPLGGVVPVGVDGPVRAPGANSASGRTPPPDPGPGGFRATPGDSPRSP
jgi:uncharacterized alkaline shock family protein YloU